MQGNQNHLCEPIMRSNCFCDSYSTTRRVRPNMFAAQTLSCSLPLLLLLLLLWGVAGLRGWRLEAEGWGVGVIDRQSMWICCPNDNTRAAFSNFSTLRLGFKKVRLQDPFGRSAKMMQNVCLHTKVFPCGWPLRQSSDCLQYTAIQHQERNTLEKIDNARCVQQQKD